MDPPPNRGNSPVNRGTIPRETGDNSPNGGYESGGLPGDNLPDICNTSPGRFLATTGDLLPFARGFPGIFAWSSHGCQMVGGVLPGISGDYPLFRGIFARLARDQWGIWGPRLHVVGMRGLGWMGRCAQLGQGQDNRCIYLFPSIRYRDYKYTVVEVVEPVLEYTRKQAEAKTEASNSPRLAL